MIRKLLQRCRADGIPETYREEVAALPAPQRSAFVELYNHRARSTPLAYALCLLIGGHYAYVGRWKLQLLFWVTLGGLLIWWVADLRRIPGMIRRYNEMVARDLVHALKAGAS